MNKNTKTTTMARHLYAEAYTNYLRSGNLEDATRQVAQDIYRQRGGAPGSAQHDWQEAERITMAWPATITEASKAHLYDKAVAKTRLWLKELEEELNYSNPNQAYRALRAVLHAIRDRLSVEECANFASQLPTLIAGVYYTGWTPVNKPVKIRKTEDFLERVSSELPSGTDPRRVTEAVFRLLDHHISKGEMQDVRRNFPERMRGLWDAEARKS